ILAIPTDSLIKDTSADIESKAKRIAVQLDEIQRILDIRFPVFILITKADLIPGFREFFKDLADPELEHQMIGWSNPAPLDAAFNPQQVDEYLSGLVKSIEKRRYPLLREPDHSGADHGERWLDQVDSVYTFPRALEHVFPRLKRFLELIFVAGEWAQKPLFLRGIYITSSLQEGAVLDQDLALALGLEVQDLPEEISFVRKGALFLRDVYLEKIFREKSLVTRATNAGGVVKRRQMLVFGIGFAALAASLALAWFSSTSLRSSIGDQQAYWSLASGDRLWNGDRWRLPVVEDSPVQDGFISNEEKFVNVKEEQLTYVDFLARLTDFTREEIKTPVIFKPVEWISTGLTSREVNRLKALKVVYEAGVLQPLITGAHDEFELPDTAWTPEARDALTSLIRMERQIAESRLGLDPDFNESREIVPSLMRYLTGKSGDPRLVEIGQWIYVDSPDANGSWPPLWASAGTSLETNRAIRLAVEKFIGYVLSKSASQQDNLVLIEEVLAQLIQIDEAEKALFAAVSEMDAGASAASVATAREILSSKILPSLETVRRQQAQLIERGVLSADEPFLLGVAYERELASARETIQSTISEIQSELPAEGPLSEAGQESSDLENFTLFSDIRERLNAAQAETAQIVASALAPDQVAKLKFFDGEFLSPNAAGNPSFQARISIYTALLGAFESGKLERSPIGHLEERIDAFDTAYAAMNQGQGYGGPREVAVRQTSEKLLGLYRNKYFRDLASEYRQGLDALVDRIRFPLVLPVSNPALSGDELKAVSKLLDSVDEELQDETLEPFAAAERRFFKDLRNRLRPIREIGRSLALGSTPPHLVEVSLPDQQSQNDVLRELLSGNAATLVNYKWEEVRLNNERSVRTRRPTGEALGSVPLDAASLSLRFYRLNTEDSDPVSYTGGWAPLQWLLSNPSL
ncbi:MAG TPA: type VI secretion system protein, partial [Oceanipulchritudo sp.]|nr:type VI secretion system protein [Oceanipulchritudo sp.]